MVARINTGKSIRKALNYNEKKVLEGQAEILSAHYFLKDADQMSFYEKIGRFEKLTSLNEKVVTNTLHVSLNFDPSEKLNNDEMVAIANNYMKRIGFGDQPYLIYRHFDTGHPHIHIVSTNIQADGSRISMHNMGRNQSEVARKEIEIEFGLVKAESKRQFDQLKLKPVSAARINPGKRATKAAISNVLGVVVDQYKYSSLAELNKVLKLYNVIADRCGEDSETYKHKGLLFRVLDERGNKTGTPIKASLFHMRPTLTNLEKRFAKNELLKAPHATRLRATIDYALLRTKQPSLERLIKMLEGQRISTILQQNKDGFIYGITYVDHHTKCVFNGSDLGKQYSAKTILERCGDAVQPLSLSAGEKKNSLQSEISTSVAHGYQSQLSLSLPEAASSTAPLDYVPHQLKRGRKKRKKKQVKL